MSPGLASPALPSSTSHLFCHALPCITAPWPALCSWSWFSVAAESGAELPGLHGPAGVGGATLRWGEPLWGLWGMSRMRVLTPLCPQRVQAHPGRVHHGPRRPHAAGDQGPSQRPRESGRDRGRLPGLRTLLGGRKHLVCLSLSLCELWGLAMSGGRRGSSTSRVLPLRRSPRSTGSMQTTSAR